MEIPLKALWLTSDDETDQAWHKHWNAVKKWKQTNKQKNYLSPFLSNYNFYLSCNHLVSHWGCRLSTTSVPPVQAPCWFPVSNANIILCSSVHFLSIYHSSGESIVEDCLQKPYAVPSGQQSQLQIPSPHVEMINKENKIFFNHNISESTLLLLHVPRC